MSLYDELKRRNVFRVAAAYIVVGWLLLQVADVLFEYLLLPDWVGRALVALLVLGFVPALILAWVFEITPDGVQRDDGAHVQSNGHQAKKLDMITIGAVLVVVVSVFYQQLTGSGGERTQASESESAAVAMDAASTERPSIAVLAFDNMSPDPANAFFAEGISEEILNILAGVEGLKVASRTSAFSFRDKGTPIPEIAEQLGVAHVLEGSVRKSGDRVRITAQLIDARDDAHLWSESYDRDLTDIFAVQEEIANAIAGAMRGALGLASISVDAPTEDLEAYQLFLRGRKGFYERGRSLDQAARDLQRAVELDPGFAEAWAHLAAVANVGTSYGDLFTTWDQARALEIGQEAATRALDLDPDNALALGAMGGIQADNGNLLEAIHLFEQAVAADPEDSTANMWLADTLMRWGYVEEALPHAETAYQQDPLVGINNGVLGVIYLTLGQPELAMPRLDKAEALGWRGHDGAGFRYEYVTGDLAALRERFQPGADGEPLTEQQIETGERFMAVAEGRETLQHFRAHLEQAVAADPEADGMAFLSLVMGDAERGMPWLQDLASRSPNWIYVMRIMWMPQSQDLLEDPELFRLLQSWDVIELYEQRGYPPGCVRTAGPDGDHLDCSQRFGGAA